MVKRDHYRIRHDNAPPYALYAQALKEGTNQGTWIRCPYSDGTQGDRLWVRERFCIGYDTDGTGRTFSALPWSGSDPQRDGKAFYAASFSEKPDEPRMPWRSPACMPRWASRLTLEVTDVRVERLQDISNADKQAEGIPVDACYTPLPGHLGNFEVQWNALHGKRAPWASNPWVWALIFKVVRHG